MNIEVKSLSCPNRCETDTYNIIIDYDIMMIHCTGCQSILAVIPTAMLYADDDINVNVLLEIILSEMQYITSHSDVVCPVCGHGNNYVIYRYNHEKEEFAYQCDCDCIASIGGVGDVRCRKTDNQYDIHNSTMALERVISVIYNQSEHELMNSIKSTLERLGYIVFRANVGRVKLADGRWFSTGLPKGFSDLFACKNGRTYFIEVKVRPNKPSPEQVIFLENMRFNGFTADVVYSVEEAIRLVNEPEFFHSLL